MRTLSCALVETDLPRVASQGGWSPLLALQAKTPCLWENSAVKPIESLELPLERADLHERRRGGGGGPLLVHPLRGALAPR